jgi:hypothetical protein
MWFPIAVRRNGHRVLAWKIIKTLDDPFIPDGIDRPVNLTNELAAVAMGKKDHPCTSTSWKRSRRDMP